MDTTAKAPELTPLRFSDFVVDPGQRSVQRGADTITLTPKTWAVLHYLATHRDRVVTKDELFAAGWPDTVVSDAALSWCIKEIRRALGDTGRHPRYLRTVYGQGYQLIAPSAEAPDPLARRRDRSPAEFVGRAAELARLEHAWARATGGRRQVVFVTGEPGIGKTTLVGVFLDGLRSERVVVAVGQCVEQFGMGEAYHPVLDALNQLAHGPDRETLVEVLSTHAPSWLANLAALLPPAERDALAARAQGITQTQALRELADAVDALAEHRPLVLVLEDVHWSDTATLAFVSFLARRPTPARVLVLATYRPIEVGGGDHPLREAKAELQLHGLCEEIPLGFLERADVHAYAAGRLGRDSEDLAAELHRRSGGNPLFLANLVDYLERDTEARTDGGLAGRLEALRRVVPERIQEFVVAEIEHLPAEAQRVVEAASVGGTTFHPALVAAALGREQDEVEEICGGLGREGRFVRELDEVTWPDGSIQTPYTFRHALYREVAYERIPSGRRRRLHRAIGTRLEAGYGEHTKEVAGELAQHFAEGRETEKGVGYYALAAETALRRGAHREIVLQATRGLALLQRLPPTPALLARELALQTLRAQGYAATRSHTAPEVEDALRRARELSGQAGDVPRQLLILLGLFHLYHGRGDMRQARECAEASMALAAGQHPVFLLGAQYTMGVNALYRGALADAQAQLDQVGAGYESTHHKGLVRVYGFNLVVICRLFGAIALALRGHPEQATRRIEETLAMEPELTHPFTSVYAHCVAPLGYHCVRDDRALAAQVEIGVTLGTRHGFPIWVAFGTVLRGWGKVAEGALAAGTDEMRRGFASMEQLGARSQWAHYKTMLAEALAQAGEHAEGLAHLDEALADMDRGDERFYEPETWRVKGELTLRSRSADAEACFLRAIETARGQEARLFELRAAVSLGRWWQSRGRTAQARELLAPLHAWFTEGFDRPDLQDAAALLATLS